MTVLSVDQVSPGVYQWRCHSCQKPIDITDTDFLRYVLDTGDIPYCYDCDNVHEGEHPKLFWNFWEYDWMIGEGPILTAYEYDKDTAFLVRTKTFASRLLPLEMGYVLAEQGAKKVKPPACPVLHNSTSVRENE